MASNEREALVQRYCPVHGDLLAGARSPRCSEAPKGHEFLHRQGQITEAMVEAGGKALFLSHLTDNWGETAPEIATICSDVAFSVIQAAEEVRRG